MHTPHPHHHRLPRPRRRRSERGSITLELAVLAPVLFILIGALLYGGRLAIADQSVQSAAEQAAREASLARDPGTARTRALSGARESLAQQNLECISLDVQIDTGGFSSPPGTPAKVTARVTCRLKTSDLTYVPGIPGSKTLDADAVSPIDTYRER